MMTKEEANYREVHFCSFCRNFQFRYGDYYCCKLEAPVSESGWCDYYEKDGKPTPAKLTVKPKVCNDCVYNMGGMCGKTGELAKKACAAYSTEIVMEPPVVADKVSYECTTCADSYYDDDGIAMCKRFNGQLNMSDLTACEEYRHETLETVD
jgi:hypothetical protein